MGVQLAARKHPGAPHELCVMAALLHQHLGAGSGILQQNQGSSSFDRDGIVGHSNSLDKVECGTTL